MSTLFRALGWLYRTHNTGQEWWAKTLESSRQRASDARRIGRMERGEIDG
jgi:hypothetical protein